jgi:glycosyltransferase involved in cell wall biosynthesis
MAGLTPEIELSVIIPAKNEAPLLQRTLPSLYASIAHWGGHAEVILVDNGSTDTTVEIATSFGCRVMSEPRGTIARLRNRGASASIGTVLAFLDADCLVAANWIRYCFERLENDGIDVVGTRAVPDASGSWVQSIWFDLIVSKRPEFPNWIGTSNLLIKSDTFIDAGGFDENLETAEDVAFCNRIRQRGKRICLEQRIDTIHLGEISTLSELFRKELWRGRSSMRCFRSSHQSVKELPSILVPAVYMLSLILLPVSFHLESRVALALILFLLIVPLVFVAYKKASIHSGFHFAQLYAVSFTYISARSCSILYELGLLTFSTWNRLRIRIG